MRLIFKNVDTNNTNNTNNTNLKYIIPNDTIIEKFINTESGNESRQKLALNKYMIF